MVDSFRATTVEDIMHAEVIAGDIDNLKNYFLPNLPSFLNDGGCSLLTTAVITDRLPVVKLLLENGCSVNPNTMDQELPPLMHAFRRGNFKIMELLLQHGAFFNFGFFAEMLFRYRIDVKKLKKINRLLLSHGINPYEPDCLGTCLLHIAASAGYAYAKNGNPPLPLEMLYHWARTMQFFINKGADVNVRSEDGSTPLHLAVGWPGGLKVLLMNGAELDAKNCKGLTPIYLAVCGGYERSTKLLLMFGANIQGNPSILNAAVTAGNLAIVSALLQRGELDVNFVDGAGMTALHYSAYLGRNEITSRLLEVGARVFDVDYEVLTNVESLSHVAA